MRDVLDPHPVTRLVPPILAAASGVCGLGCVLVAFRGGALPFFGIEVEGSVVTGLLWLILLAPLLSAGVYLVTLHIVVRLDPWLNGRPVPAARRRRGSSRLLRAGLLVVDRVTEIAGSLVEQVVAGARKVGSLVRRAALGRPRARVATRVAGRRAVPSSPPSPSDVEDRSILDRAEEDVEEMEKRLASILRRLRNRDGPSSGPPGSSPAP